MPVVATVAAATRRLGLSPEFGATGGGSDANVFREAGIVCVVLSTGQMDPHTTHEHIAITDMVRATHLLQEVLGGA